MSEQENNHSEETVVNNDAEQVTDEREAAYKTLLSAYAEAENRMKRLEKEKAEAVRFAVQGFARDLTEVLDALQQAGENVTVEGVAAVNRLLVSICARHGLKALHPLGEAFDPYHHEAVGQIQAEKKGEVLQVLQSGYVLHERLLRPARVVVSI